MSMSNVLFLIVVFMIVGAVALLAMTLFSPGYLRGRLNNVHGKDQPGAHENDGWVEKVVKVATPFSRLSLPEEGWERSMLRTRFMNAGWRSPGAATLYFAAKTVLALGLPGIAALVVMYYAPGLPARRFMLLLLVTAAFGYYIPNFVLERVAKRRERDIFETIPDALDLLTVCVEAGLSLERALVKVAAEIHVKSMVLAQELQLVLMEMRAGFTKERALRNFALRSGVEDVDTLVAMLIQSERFGTSMGTSLRVYSDNLRTKRRMMAEEAAAKIALKLLFPLIFFIFPSLLIVLVGPAGIQIARTMAKMSGAN
jgi:tight adherence protein C